MSNKHSKIGELTLKTLVPWILTLIALAPGGLLTSASVDAEGDQPVAKPAQSFSCLKALPTLRPNDDAQPTPQNGQTNASQVTVTPSSSEQGASPQPVALPPENAKPLTEESKLQLLRYVDGEFARVLAPLPGGGRGFHLKAGVPLDQESLRKALAMDGSALNVGDSVQITKVEFHERGILFEINNGPKGKTSWHDRIHFEGGLGLPAHIGSNPTREDVPVAPQKTGATIVLDFGRAVPDMTGEQLKAYLGSVLDFSKRSAAMQYMDSLPPKMREAIAARRAKVGMDHDEVTAALGRPDRKIREQDSDGNDTEDWVYGRPPAKTIFVTFKGDSVVRVTEYP